MTQLTLLALKIHQELNNYDKTYQQIQTETFWKASKNMEKMMKKLVIRGRIVINKTTQLNSARIHEEF